MIRGLENLAAMRYPGRGIILGRDLGAARAVVVYFITGRSASSQARKFVWEGGTLWTRPTDEETLKKGQPDLLIYPAVVPGEGGVAVSNGKQTSDLAKVLTPGFEPRKALVDGLKAWSFEPDSPIFTPRISGCVGRDGRAGLHIIKRRADGTDERLAFGLPAFAAGRGLLLTTYAGRDLKICPAFAGSPRPVRLTASRSAAELVEAVYRALCPPRGKKDYRVAAACLFVAQGTGKVEDVALINRHEREAKKNG